MDQEHFSKVLQNLLDKKESLEEVHHFIYLFIFDTPANQRAFARDGENTGTQGKGRLAHVRRERPYTEKVKIHTREGEIDPSSSLKFMRIQTVARLFLKKA